MDKKLKKDLPAGSPLNVVRDLKSHIKSYVITIYRLEKNVIKQPFFLRYMLRYNILNNIKRNLFQRTKSLEYAVSM